MFKLLKRIKLKSWQKWTIILSIFIPLIAACVSFNEKNGTDRAFKCYIVEKICNTRTIKDNREVNEYALKLYTEKQYFTLDVTSETYNLAEEDKYLYFKLPESKFNSELAKEDNNFNIMLLITVIYAAAIVICVLMKIDDGSCGYGY